jgi:hypothetical protein
MKRMNKEEYEKLESACRNLAEIRGLELHQVVARLIDCGLLEDWDAELVYMTSWKRPLDSD